MTGNNPAINILSDVVVTIQGTTGGDNGNPSRTLAGSPLTFKADKITVDSSFSTADHSTAQSGAEFHRITKKPQSIKVETKLEKATGAALMALLSSTAGAVVSFTITATGATMTSCIGLVADLQWEYAGPSTLSFGLKQYGTEWVVTTS